MVFNTEKFNTEIKKLKSLAKSEILHPLKKAQIKQDILSNLNNPTVYASKSIKLVFYKRGWFLRYVLPSAGAFLLLSGTTFAAQGSVPGDILYPVKQVKENIQLTLSPNDEIKANLKAKFAEERIKEIKKIRSNRPKPEPKLEETVNSTTTLPLTLTEEKNEIEAKSNLEKTEKDLGKLKNDLVQKGNTKAAKKLERALEKIRQEKEDENPFQNLEKKRFKEKLEKADFDQNKDGSKGKIEQKNDRSNLNERENISPDFLDSKSNSEEKDE